VRDYLVPELAAIADGFPKLNLADLASTREFIRQAAAHRAAYESNRTLSVANVVLPGYQGEPDVAGRVYAPAEAAEAVPGLIYLFGGGYVAGSIDTIDYASRLLADRAGIAVVAIAYRLAPENPYPVALNDAPRCGGSPAAPRSSLVLIPAESGCSAKVPAGDSRRASRWLPVTAADLG
jgi:acetyl esterase/lipase